MGVWDMPGLERHLGREACYPLTPGALFLNEQAVARCGHQGTALGTIWCLPQVGGHSHGLGCPTPGFTP